MRAIGPVTCLALAAVVVAGCNGAVRGENDEVVEGGDVGAFDVRVGDCFTGDDLSVDTSEVSSVEATPCDQPHDNEVYAVFELPDGDYPGDEPVVEESAQGCLDRFEDFIGIAYDDSLLDITHLFPTEASWDTLDDREVVCAVYDPVGPVEGSLEGQGELYALPGEGDCITDDWTTIDCAQEHFAEIFLVTDIEEADYPGDQEVEQLASDLCLAAFPEFVGAEYGDSELDYFYFNPEAESWELGDREVWCGVADPAGSLTGSVRGSGR